MILGLIDLKSESALGTKK